MLTSDQRKEMPVFRGAIRYFPDALKLVAMLSLRADRKHSPDADPNDMDRPQWVKGKSADHEDCLVRHLSEIGTFDDEVGLDHRVHVAWRGLAQLQAAIDKQGIHAFFRDATYEKDDYVELEDLEDWREYLYARSGDADILIIERKDA